jgi:hypothetical protein
MLRSKPKDHLLGDHFDYDCPTKNGHRYPRTLTEAFGPYTSTDIEEPPSTIHSWVWWVFLVAFAVIAVVARIVFPESV